MEYVDRVLLLHKSLSKQMKFHLQVTAQLVKLEKIQYEKSVASLGCSHKRMKFSHFYPTLQKASSLEI